MHKFTRFTDVVEETGVFANPIRGLDSLPVVSFMESLAPLRLIIPSLEGYAWMSLQFAESINNDIPRSLTVDEVAALNIYTREWPEASDSLYYKVNHILRSEDRSQLKPFFPYLKLVLGAICKLPKHNGETQRVWRGISETTKINYTKGKKIFWWGFSSCTVEMGVLERFLGSGKQTLFNINCKNGVNIKQFSAFKGEIEILLPPGTYLEVTNILDTPSVHIIEMKEIDTSFPIESKPNPMFSSIASTQSNSGPTTFSSDYSLGTSPKTNEASYPTTSGQFDRSYPQDFNSPTTFSSDYSLGTSDYPKTNDDRSYPQDNPHVTASSDYTLNTQWKVLDDTPNQISKGQMYLLGSQYKEALACFQALANEKNNSVAFLYLGLLYEQFIHPTDLVYAGRCYARALESIAVFKSNVQESDTQSNFQLGLLYEHLSQAPEDAAEAIRFYQAAANKGDVMAQYQLGLCYQKGKGVIQSNAVAITFYQLSAQAKYAPSMFQLGVCYENGQGVAKDLKLAFDFYQQAANKGHAVAQNSVGLFYESGLGGLKQNVVLAVQYYELSSNQGYVLAQHNLGVVYENGRPGVSKDLHKAVHYYQLAVAQNYPRSQSNLARFYETGQGGLPLDLNLAVHYYQEAANQGYARAQFNLGVCYETGRGVTKNLEMAKNYYQLAVSANERISPEANKLLMRLLQTNPHLQNTPQPLTNKTPSTGYPSTMQNQNTPQPLTNKTPSTMQNQNTPQPFTNSTPSTGYPSTIQYQNTHLPLTNTTPSTTVYLN